MSRLSLSKDEIRQYAQEVLQSPKYRTMDIPQDLIESLYIQESPHHKRLQDLHKAVRKKLHNIIATYLGDSDYDQATQDLKEAFLQDEQAIKAVCTQILESHISTQERIPFLDVFYQEIFSRVGKPQFILDLACGYHPFGLPWMNLDPNCRYYAFDIIKARVDFINTFFGLLHRPPLAFQQDILIHPPEIEADLAFFFKEAHRFDQRQRGCNRIFWQALKVNNLLVSLPATSMSMRHDKSDQHRRLVYDTLKDLNWSVEEFQVENELFFWIRK